MSYPATFEVQTPERIANWRPLVHWLLALPHLFIANALEALAGAVAVISWFAILFTGRLPQGLASIQVMIMRYTLRVETYAGFLHDQYPPFDFSMTDAEPGGTPTTASYVPDLGERNRLTVGLRIFIAIPALLYALVIGIVGILAYFLAFFAVLFTGRWPEGLRLWAVRMMRVGNRLNAYLLLLTDEYPPFSTD